MVIDRCLYRKNDDEMILSERILLGWEGNKIYFIYLPDFNPCNGNNSFKKIIQRLGIFVNKKMFFLFKFLHKQVKFSHVQQKLHKIIIWFYYERVHVSR